MYQDLLKADISKLLQTGLIQGKNPRVLARELKKAFDTTTYNAERLMRTELARVQTEAQKQSFQRNGFSLYEYIANSTCCDICQGLNGKHFKVESMMPGENAPPMHPNCRCSTAAWEDSEEYDAWVDYLANGGTTYKWNASEKFIFKSIRRYQRKQNGGITEEWDRKNTEKSAIEKINKNGTLVINIQLFAKKSEDFKTVYLPRKEYGHVMHEISTNLTEEQARKKVFCKKIGDYIYTVENNGFGNYRVIKKLKLKRIFSMDENEKVKNELIEKLKPISNDRDFILAIINIARSDEDRKNIIRFIENSDNVTDENIILLAMTLEEASGKQEIETMNKK